MSYRDPVVLLNGMLDDLGEEQDAEEWATDPVEAEAWFTANHPTDGRLLEAWIDHVSVDAVGYTSVTLTRTRLASARPRTRS
jgi:hypothetical protein